MSIEHIRRTFDASPGLPAPTLGRSRGSASGRGEGRPLSGAAARALLAACCLLITACGPIVDRAEKPATGSPMPTAALAPALAAALDAQLDSLGGAVDAVVVQRDGKTIYAWGAVETPSNLASARKSVLSVLFGIAAARGLVDLDATLDALGIDETQAPLSATERRATIRDLLASRSGVYRDAAAEGETARAVRAESTADAPGEAFLYNNWGFNVLGAIFAQETGLSIGEALATWIGGPIGMEDLLPAHVFVDESDSPSDYPAYRMFMSARDLARLGTLILNEGVWEGKAIVAPEWIADMATPLSTVGPPMSEPPFDGYGLSWWVNTETGALLASGWGGQLLYVDFATDTSIALLNDTGNTPLAFALFRAFGAMPRPEDLLQVVRLATVP